MKKFLQKLVVILFVGVFAVGAFAQTTPTIAEGEQAVFFENTGNWSGDIYAYIWADGGAVEWVGGWPGEACTYLGDNIWKWTYSGKMNIYGETTVYGGLIFNNKGAGMQTADLEFVNGGYYNANGYVKTITPTGGDEVDSSLVALSNVFVAGSFNNWASKDQEHSMSLELDFYIKRYENMPAGTYEFKIVDNGKWIGAEYVDAANSTKGYVGVPGGNISFTLPQPATVIISYAPWYEAIYLVAEGIDKFGQFEIEYYSVCGSKEIFGEDFLTDVYRENIDDYKMVEEDGVYTKTFTSIHLDAGVEYRYKVAANGTWNEGQYPQNGDMLFTVPQTGIYDLTFTYVPATSTLRVDPVIVENLGEEEGELSDTVRFANIASIYKKGIWEMERYQDYSAFSVIAILESQPTVVDKVVSSSAWGNATNNYYLNDGTGVIVLQAPATGVDSWMGTTIEGLELEVGTKLPAEFFATIDFKAVIDDETWLPSGEVYGAPVMTFMPKVLGVEVDEYGLENQITESYADFVARCEVSDFVENVVEVSVEELFVNRINYAGKLLSLNTDANYYAEVLKDDFSGVTTTTAYMYWNASEVFDVEVYDGTTFVSPKMTEDWYNYIGKLFNIKGENLPVASFDAKETINVATARFDWNAIEMGQSLLVKDYIVGEEEPVVPPTAMPANGVIYFDPAGKFTESLSVRFIGADGSVQDAAEVINVGEIYRITMPAGDEWMRFEVDAWGDDPTTPESNFVQLYLVSGLVYTGEYNLFTLNADAPNQATAENGVWSNHVVQPIQGGSVFFYSLAESAYFSEAEEGVFAWKVFFVNAEGTEAEVEMELIDGAMYKIVAPEGTWDMLRISLYAAATGREVNRLYLENDGEHNMFKLGADASPYALVGSWDVYNTEVPEVIATWSIEEGAVIESFTGVTITFSGVDPRGRRVDGTEVTRVLPVISAVKTFFVVNEDGTTTPVVADGDNSKSGVLTYSASGVTSTLSLGTDRYTLVDGAFLKNGNYRIVLPANKVQYLPNVDGTKVYAEKDFVLNFSIVNDYVEPEPITEVEVPFIVSVENNSTVAELSEIVITYPDVAMIGVSAPMEPQTPATWVFLSQTLVDETGNVTASQAMAPLYWEQVSANSFKVMVNLSAIGGPETLTMEGTYSIDVPAGLVMFSETEVNKAFSLNYTIETVSPEEPAGPIEVTTMDELKAHAGETVIYKGLEPIAESFMGMNNYFMPDGETMLYCELTRTLPARFDAKGIYSAEEGMFAVQEFVAIYAFNTVSDLNMFLQTSNPTEAQKVAAYEIKGSVVVTYVDAMFGKIYAQYEVTHPYGFGTMMYGIEFTLAGPSPRVIGESVDPTQLQPGDEIVVTGIYTAAVSNDETGDLISPESFALTVVNLVSQNNELKATPVSSIDEAKWSYVSGYMSIKGGTVAEGVTGYTLTDAYGGVLNVMQASAETDLSAYVGKELDKILVGVLTYNAMLQDYVLYALELRESKEYFDNIAALIAAGPQMDYSISRALRNPVVVNKILYMPYAGYTLFVEDATGVLVVRGVGVLDEETYDYTFPYEIEEGDSILGIDGVLSNGVMWTGTDYGINVDLTYVSEGEVNVIEVALDALMADQAAWQEASWNGEVYVSPYANRVVKLTDLTLEETDDDATAYWVQGESKLEFNPRLWNRLGLEVPANVAALTGIADYEGIWNYSFTVIPTNVEVEDDCTVFVAGSFNNWNPSDPEHCMVLGDLAYVKTYKNLPAGSYEFKVVYKGQWLGAEYVDAANSTKGYVGVPGGNISFTLPQAATVTISYYDWMEAIYLVAEGIDQFGQFEIEYYSVCGSKEIFGEEFLTDAYREKIDDYKMVEEDGVYTKTFTSIHLDADVEYRYKVAANGTWNEGQYPQNGDMLFTVSQTGIYDLTFTYIPDSDLLRVDPVFIESSNVIDSVYYEAVTCYGDVYEFGGMVFYETGTYELWEGSNTLAILNLTVLPDYRQTYDATIKEGEVYSGHGFNGLTQPGTYMLPLISLSTGCDSTITLNLSVVAAGGPIEVTTMDELKAHAGETVIYKGLEPTVVTMGWETMTLMPDGETMLYCELTNTLPARFDAKGIYSAEEGMFAVQEFVAIYAFNTVSDLNMFLQISNPTEEQKAAAYEIKGSVVVTYVDAMFGKIYAQYEGTHPYGFGTMMYGIEFTLAGPSPRVIGESVDPTQLQPGDEIVVTGIYTAAVYNDETGNLISPESFALTAVNLVSQNNELKATPVSSIDEAKWSCVSGYMSIKGGTVAEGVTGYTLTDAYGGVLNVMQASAETDLSAYVGKELDKILVGVLAYNAMLQDYVLYALELRDTRVYYDNIAALLASGSQMDYSISRALRNPVVLNYIYYNEWEGYTLFVEDATGVLVVKGVGVMDEDDNYTFPYEVEAGDSILGIDGVLDNGVMWTGADYGIDVDLTYVSEGEVNVIEVALDALVEDQAAWQEASWNGEAYVSPYANRVVKLTDLALEETDDDATAYWVQGESKLEFNPKKWALSGWEVPANIAALTGIADYNGIWNYSFTVIPTNVEVESDIIEESREEVICYGDVYEFGGMVLSETGIYQLESANGDTIITLNLTVLPAPIYVEEYVAINYGGSYYWMGEEYTMDGTYSYVEKYSIGCDSMIYVLNLTVLPNDRSKVEVDGIYYYLNTDNTATVTSPDEGVYYGDIVIPDEVVYDDKVYEVISIEHEDVFASSLITSLSVTNNIISGISLYECYDLYTLKAHSDFIASCTNIRYTNITELYVTGGYVYWSASILSKLELIDMSAAENTELWEGVFMPHYDIAYNYFDNLRTIVLPTGLTTIATRQFQGLWMLEEIVIPEGVTEIPNGAFYDCHALRNVTFEGEITSIGNYAFYNCHAMESVVIPEGVTEIGNAAFYGCTYLEEIELPYTLEEVGDNAFALCSKVRSIKVNAHMPPALRAKTFYEVDRNTPVYVADVAYDDYVTDQYWSEFFNIIAVPEYDGPTTDVDANNEHSVVIYTQGGMIYIEGVETDYNVFDATGRLIYNGRDAQLSLPKGAYMLSVGDKTYKVAM